MTQSKPVAEPWMFDMNDDRAAWWAKLRRAHAHRKTLEKLIDEFEVAYRLSIRREAPAEISTVVGDVLHNLRSALDSLAHELAVQSKGQALTQEEEFRTSFPWCKHPSDYDGRMRGGPYGPEAQNAMRVVQPFYWAETNNEPEPQRQKHSEEDFKWSLIHRLSQLNNIDKHRCLPALGVGWSRLFRSSGEGHDMWFRSGHIAENTILDYSGADARNIELEIEFALVLTDDPIHKPEARYAVRASGLSGAAEILCRRGQHDGVGRAVAVLRRAKSCNLTYCQKGDFHHACQGERKWLNPTEIESSYLARRTWWTRPAPCRAVH